MKQKKYNIIHVNLGKRESCNFQNSRAKTSISSTDQSVYAPAKT